MQSTSSALVEPSDLLGVQTPSYSWVPPHVSSAGREAIDLAALAGLDLDPCQQTVLMGGLGEKPNGKWSAFEVGVVQARQSGKGGILEARQLAGLFLFGERLIIHSAHEQATSSEHFLRLLNLIEGVPEFSRRMLKPSRGKGAEAIRLRGGQRILFKTRTGGGGRGLTGDLVVLDEAMILPEEMSGVIVPITAARTMSGNPQIWYTGSAVDQQKHEHGVVFARVRQRGYRRAKNVAYFEWAVPGDDPDRVPDEVRRDPEMWARANPAMGIRISQEHIANECDGALGSREFAVERLSVGDWPRTDGKGTRVFSEAAWIACGDPDSEIEGAVSFAVDATPEHTHGAIAVAGERADGLGHFEIVDHRKGTEWMVPRCVELQGRNPDAEFAVDGHGPVAALIADLTDAGVTVREVSTQDYGRACGAFAIAVAAATAEATDEGDDPEPRGVRYRTPQPELSAALVGATKRSLGDAWAWSRRNSSVDISPLVASTLALWLAEAPDRQPAFDVADFRIVRI